MSYTPSFTPEYEDGWEDLPLETTPITAEALNKYDDAIENIETYLSENDIVDANANIADEYDATATYSKDDYVIYSGNLYKAKQDISTAEAWDSTHWDACIVTDEMSQGGSLVELSDVDLENLADGDIIRYNGTSGKFENVPHWGTPTWETESADMKTVGSEYNVTFNGFISVYISPSVSNAEVYYTLQKKNTDFKYGTAWANSGFYNSFMIPVSSGDILTVLNIKNVGNVFFDIHPFA